MQGSNENRRFIKKKTVYTASNKELNNKPLNNQFDSNTYLEVSVYEDAEESGSSTRSRGEDKIGETCEGSRAFKRLCTELKKKKKNKKTKQKGYHVKYIQG